MNISAANDIGGIARKIESTMLRMGFRRADVTKITVELPASVWDSCIKDAATPVVVVHNVKFRRVPG